MKLYVNKENVKLYIGLIEGNNVVQTYWNGGIDSFLQDTRNVEIITVLDKNNIEDSYEFLILDNGETIELNDNNVDRLYDYFIYNIPLEEIEDTSELDK